jgi:hypothetical protein
MQTEGLCIYSRYLVFLRVNLCERKNSNEHKVDRKRLSDICKDRRKTSSKRRRQIKSLQDAHNEAMDGALWLLVTWEMFKLVHIRKYVERWVRRKEPSWVRLGVAVWAMDQTVMTSSCGLWTQ